MDPTPDELAGVVDLFGALTRSELGAGLAELAYKRGQAYEPDAFEGTIRDAVRSYHLVPVEASGEELLVVGPVAFPELPDGGEDLPHILEVSDRRIDREKATAAAAGRFREDANVAIGSGETDRIRTLLDASYELEAWGQVDLAETRQRLDDALE